MQCKVFICKILSSQSHSEPVSNKAHGLWWYQRQRKSKYFVLNSHNKLNLCWLKTKYSCKKGKTREFWQKTRHSGKITEFTAFDENQGFCDFCVSVINSVPTKVVVSIKLHIQPQIFELILIISIKNKNLKHLILNNLNLIVFCS